MASYAKLIHNGKIQTVALMEGLEVDEVTSLLKTVFGINGNIVGIMAEKGLIIPISLVCRSPQVIPNSTCKILVSKPDASASPQQETSIAPSQGRSKAKASEQEYDESSSDDEEAAAQSVVNEIGQFLDSIRQKNQLTQVQHQLLRRLLTERSALLFAAYSVAISAGDWEYLLEVCKDIATSLRTEEGRTACEAQDEVLQVCDQLYLQGKITESQLLYLRHLTLIRDSSVATVYDDFQEHGSVTLFAKALYDVANSHPFRGGSSTVATDGGSNRGDIEVAVTGEEDEEDEDEDEEDENDDDEDDDDEQDEAVKKDISSGLIGVIVLMLRSETLSRTEAQVLLEMVQREDDYVMAAYELYLRDNNMEDLQDTLMRCVRLEIRKRVTDIQERELATLQREREEEKQQQQQQQDKDYDEATDADEEGDQDVDSEDYESGKLTTASAAIRADFGLEAITLDSLLNELGVENLWRGVVPEQFVQAVFIAVYRKFLTLEQARALCDLFQANYDLVHAAWEVYVVQKDTVDFIDTLRRIVRDLNLQEISHQYVNTRKEAQAAASQASRAADHARQAAQEGRQSAQTVSEITKTTRARGTSESDTSSGESENDAANNVTAKKREVEAAKAQALQAIDQAKSELLKHSLEMMVKQKLVSEKSADDLYQRHLEGDKLTDAAIEAYASDRDVNEFIDTLQMLAMHSREELEVLMGSAVAQQERQDAAEQSKDATTSAAQAELMAAERYLADAALQQIEEIVSEMLKNDMISAPVASAFATLITDRDPRLVHAYQEFMKNRNGTELIDALLKTVIASVQEGDRLSKSTGTAAASSAYDKAQETSVAQVLDKFDQKQIVDILFQSNAISAQSYNTICRLIEEGDTSVGRIFRRYETTKDVMHLVQDLQAMQLSFTNNSNNKDDVDNVDQQAQDEEDDDDDGNNDEGKDNQDENEDILDEDDANAIEKRFMGIIQGMALSELEQTALRLAIAENDPAIRNAIDAFRQDLSEERLVIAMRTAARAVIHRTLSSANHAEDDEEDDEENNSSEDDDEEEEEEDNNDNDKNEEEEDEDGDDDVEEMLRLSRSHYQGGDDKNNDNDDEGEEEDEEDDDEEDDEEEEDNDGLGSEGVSLITSKSARDHVFPILVQELVKENIIARKDGAIIMQQFSANNPIISTALDRYDANNDMAQLVDALQQMVENIDTNK